MQITGGKFNSRKLNTLNVKGVRPTLSKVRNAVFNTLKNLITFDNKSFLDTFAGSGVMGLEALSRGFSTAFAIEKNKKTFEILKSNYELLDVTSHSTLVFGNSLKVLNKINFEKSFDVIFADPPYESGFYELLVKIISDKNLLSKNGILILEHKFAHAVTVKNFDLIKEKSFGNVTIGFYKNCNKKFTNDEK